MEDQAPDLFADMLKDITSPDFRADPLEHRAPPLTAADIQTAIDRAMNESYQRDRYVMPRQRWERMLENASDQFRRELESMLGNGTIILSDHLPNPDIAYRFRLGNLPDPQYPHPGDWGRFIQSPPPREPS